MSLVAQSRSCILELFPGSSAVLVLFTPSVCLGRNSKWSWNGVFSFLLQVSLFLQFKRIISALWRLQRLQCADVALLGVVLFPLFDFGGEICLRIDLGPEKKFLEMKIRFRKEILEPKD